VNGSNPLFSTFRKFICGTLHDIMYNLTSNEGKQGSEKEIQAHARDSFRVWMSVLSGLGSIGP
ncbi:hypothetical protein, partial [Bacteroides acidifaciens]|uniref:hypothetical protein n=1 Tax=Bacteroides acidifaciens TaxID=85831 RepID=UPI0025A4D4E2